MLIATALRPSRAGTYLDTPLEQGACSSTECRNVSGICIPRCGPTRNNRGSGRLVPTPGDMRRLWAFRVWRYSFTNQIRHQNKAPSLKELPATPSGFGASDQPLPQGEVWPQERSPVWTSQRALKFLREAPCNSKFSAPSRTRDRRQICVWTEGAAK